MSTATPQDILRCLMTTDGPSTLQTRVEYNADGTQLYIALAPMGTLSSIDLWTISKFTYNASQQMTLKQTGLGSWDNRSLLSYN